MSFCVLVRCTSGRTVLVENVREVELVPQPGTMFAAESGDKKYHSIILREQPQFRSAPMPERHSAAPAASAGSGSRSVMLRLPENPRPRLGLNDSREPLSTMRRREL